jgi:hypothetical protein
MSNGGHSDERKVAVMLLAMQDMRTEIEGIFQKMHAAAAAMNAASGEVKQAGAAVVPAVAHATAQAVEASMKRAFADIATPARGALDQAVKPVIEKFSGLELRAVQMEATARNALTWFSTKWIVLTAAGFVGMSAMAWASVAWQRHEVSELTAQKSALETDIAEMQVNAEALAKKGARIKMTDCGGRLCIVASKNQGEGASDWHGNWNNAQTGQTFVIPQGY